MLNFISKLFRSTKNNNTFVRKLNNPKFLEEGDLIKFSYLDVSDISSKDFEVFKINTYVYGDVCYPELILKDRKSNIIFMMYEEEDGEEYIALSKKVDKADINEVIPRNTLDKIIKKGTGTKISISSTLEKYSCWLAGEYVKVDDNIQGSFLKGDARHLPNEQVAQREKFTSYLLEDAQGEKAIEIEIYESGEIEIALSVYHDIDAIEDMWPKNN